MKAQRLKLPNLTSALHRLCKVSGSATLEVSNVIREFMHDVWGAGHANANVKKNTLIDDVVHSFYGTGTGLSRHTTGRDEWREVWNKRRCIKSLFFTPRWPIFCVRSVSPHRLDNTYTQSRYSTCVSDDDKKKPQKGWAAADEPPGAEVAPPAVTAERSPEAAPRSSSSSESETGQWEKHSTCRNICCRTDLIAISEVKQRRFKKRRNSRRSNVRNHFLTFGFYSYITTTFWNILFEVFTK